MSARWRPTRAEVDLSAVRDNCGALQSLLGPGTEQLAVVKANGYGHGDVEVSRACLGSGVRRLGVALVEEGVRLREGGVDAPVLLLVEPPPEAAKEVVRHRLTPSVTTRRAAECLADAAAAEGRRLPVHVAVDTGMHREGAPLGEAVDLTLHVAGLPALEVEGVWSHLAVADEPGHPATTRQLERFEEYCLALARRGLEVQLRHLANSAGTILEPRAHYDLVRTGIAVYGLAPAPWMRGRVDLRPAMRLVSSVGWVRRVAAGEGVSYGLTYAPARDALVATVPIGYADGFMRLFSGRAEVLVGGRRRAVAGRVTMDSMMVDCGSDPVEPGDEVVLIGRQGEEEITADELAELIGTINYEIVSAVSARVPRVYTG